MTKMAALILVALVLAPAAAEARRPDTTPPQVVLTSPPAGALSGTITLSAIATDNRAVDHVTFRVDGGAGVGSDYTAPYSMQWDTTQVPDGTHVFSVRAADTSGNVSTDSVVTATVDNVSPPPPPPSPGADFVERFDEQPAGALWGGPSYFNTTHAAGWVSDCNDSDIYVASDPGRSGTVGYTNGHNACQRWYTTATFPGPVQVVEADLKPSGWGSGASASASWSGFKFFMRRDTADNNGSNYTFEPTIYDGTVHIQKKCWGVNDSGNPLFVDYSNGGSWYLLAQVHMAPLGEGVWHHIETVVTDNPDGSTTIDGYRDGVRAISATDRPGMTACPVLRNGHVGWRSDNEEYKLGDFAVSTP